MPREALLAELRRLSRRELALTLAPLSEAERRQILALVITPAPERSEQSFESMVALSPWLLKAIERARQPASSTMTAAAKAALLSALEQARGGERNGEQQPANAQRKAPTIRALRRFVPRLKRAA